MTDISAPEIGPDGLPIPNLPLLRKVLDHITAHPEQHNQGTFQNDLAENACGTTRCIAGWVNYWDCGDAHGPEHGHLGPSEYAAQLLGLTNGEREKLFFTTILYDDQRAAVQRVAEAIAARAGEIL